MRQAEPSTVPGNKKQIRESGEYRGKHYVNQSWSDITLIIL